MPPHPVHALIPCAGSGSRAGTAGPKQYQPLMGRPLVLHTLAAFAALPWLARRVVVVSPGEGFQGFAGSGFEAVPVGGATRAASVLAGLRWLRAQGAGAEDRVLVHDAARCLVEPADIERLVAACADDPVGGLLALPLPDTLKQERDGRATGTIDRSGKWLAQTPQMAPLGLLMDALALAEPSGFEGVTDEASALEARGLAMRLVPGAARNFKVTYPADFSLAEAVLRSRA